MDQLLTPAQQVLVLKLLAHSWGDIDYKYEGLTDEEKRRLPEAQFYAIFRAMLDTGIVLWPR